MRSWGTAVGLARLMLAFLVGAMVLGFMGLQVAEGSHWGGATSFFTPTIATQGVVTEFTFELTNGAGTTLSVYWVFVHFCWNPPNVGFYFKQDDGTTVSIPGSGSHQFKANILVDSSTLGNCPVEISVNGIASPDASRTTLSGTWNVDVRAPDPLQASITADPTLGPAPLTVSFTSTVTGGVPPYTYSWMFGDTPLASTGGPSPKHTYQNPGTYTATLKVTDLQGTQATTAPVTVTVTSPPPLQVSISANPTSGEAPLTVSFTSTVTGGVAPYTYSWSFGEAGASDPGANPSHTYQNAGTFTASLTVTDSQNTVEIATTSVTVTAPSVTLTASAAADRSTGEAPLTVSFSASASGGTPPYSYAWEFGGDGSSTQQNPSHTFQNPGSYTVTLTITDSQGQSVTRTITVTVNEPAGTEPPSAVGEEGFPMWIPILGIILAIGIAVAALLMRRGRATAAAPPAEPPRPPVGAPTAPQPPQAPAAPTAPPPPAAPPTPAAPAVPAAPPAPGVLSCPNCRSPVGAGEAFCGTCGTRLA